MSIIRRCVVTGNAWDARQPGAPCGRLALLPCEASFDVIHEVAESSEAVGRGSR